MKALLGARSYFSLLQSANSPEKLVEYCVANGVELIGLTDTTCGGHVRLSMACEKHNIACMFGASFVFAHCQHSVTVFAPQKSYNKLLQLLTAYDSGNIDVGSVPKDFFIFASSQDVQHFAEYSHVYSSDVLQDVRFVDEQTKQTYLALQAVAHEKKLSEVSTDHVPPKIVDESSAMLENLREDCAFYLPTGHHDFPLYVHAGSALRQDVEFGDDHFTLMSNMCDLALHEKYGDHAQAKERLAYELSVIKELEFVDYFLVMADVIAYTRSKGGYVGPGRGSSAGSIVAYLLDITRVDPLAYNLIFERFLNKGRKSPPDIDTDFDEEKRDIAIDYVRQRYGKDKVAHIGTYTTMKAKQALKDAGRILGYSFQEINAVTRDLSWKTKLSDIVEPFAAFPQLLETAKLLEGTPRQYSVHAAGIVISPKPIVHYTALYEQSITQLDMDDIERVGLVKFDFLGLRYLSILRNTLEWTKLFDSLEDIPLDDEKTYALLSAGETIGCFQLESHGMRSTLEKVQPKNIEDITAIISLYRPGASAHIDEFAQGRHGGDITYSLEVLKPILEPTFGILVYQEQVMRIAHDIAGYTLLEADNLRRAMGKKIKSLMDAEEEKFVAGCQASGLTAEQAKTLFDSIAKFAGYGFNKSHAVAYAYIAYWTAYMKVHAPAAFLCALVNGYGLQQKYLDYAKKYDIVLLPPDINKSSLKATLTDKGVLVGLRSIDGIGSSLFEKIEEQRPYKSKPQVKSLLPAKIFKLLEQHGALDALSDVDASQTGLGDF